MTDAQTWHETAMRLSADVVRLAQALTEIAEDRPEVPEYGRLWRQAVAREALKGE